MKLDPLFVGPRKAAALLDMHEAEFLGLVERGYLPRPRRIGEVERFDVAELRAVILGDKAGGGDMEW